MKFVFNAFLVLCTSITLLAQKNVAEIGVHGAPINRLDKAVLDTVFNGFETYNPVIYVVPDTGGYVSGSNGFKDIAKAQELKPAASSYLTGAIFWFGKNIKNTGGDTSSVILKYQRKDSVQMVAGQYKFVPGTVVLADTIKLNTIPADSILNNAMLVWNFPSPQHVFSAFYLGFDMSLMNAKDSIALYTSTHGEVINADLSWEYWLNKWNTIENSWNLNIDFAIFPIFDIENASLENVDPNASFTMYPNPAQNEIFVNSKEGVSTISILDMNGRLLQLNSNQQQINISQLPTGTYLIKVETKDGKMNFGRFVKSN